MLRWTGSRARRSANAGGKAGHPRQLPSACRRPCSRRSAGHRSREWDKVFSVNVIASYGALSPFCVRSAALKKSDRWPGASSRRRAAGHRARSHRARLVGTDQGVARSRCAGARFYAAAESRNVLNVPQPASSLAPAHDHARQGDCRAKIRRPAHARGSRAAENFPCACARNGTWEPASSKWPFHKRGSWAFATGPTLPPLPSTFQKAWSPQSSGRLPSDLSEPDATICAAR